MNIITLYRPCSTDGYTHFPEDIFFDNSLESARYAKEKHGGYAVDSSAVKAIEGEPGYYYLLSRETPVTIHGSLEFGEQARQAALGRISPQDKAILGL
jgi:hypothetical protein